jgi:hypothetical protein
VNAGGGVEHEVKGVARAAGDDRPRGQPDRRRFGRRDIVGARRSGDAQQPSIFQRLDYAEWMIGQSHG